MKTVTIAGSVIGPGHPLFVIAEIGGNFTTYEGGKRLIDEARHVGADAVKLQTYRAETVSSKKAMFDMENTGVASQYELFKQYELSEELHEKLFDSAKTAGIPLFSTPGHPEDVDLLEKLGTPAHKIGSDDACNLPFLEYVAKTGKPIILSTGMCTLEEVRESVSTILGTNNDQLILLHCVTNYPTYPENVNLRAMCTLKKEFGLPAGYSDHTLTPSTALAAAALGADVLECHFTLDKNAEGPDHMLSSDPKEMKFIIESIREIEQALGDGIKRPAVSEKTMRYNNRKSIVTVKTIVQGERVSGDAIAIKRPGYGIAPKYFNLVIGRTAKQTIDAEEALNWDMLE